MRKNQTRRSQKNVDRERAMLTGCFALGEEAEDVLGIAVDCNNIWKAQQAQAVRDQLRQLAMEVFTSRELHGMGRERLTQLKATR